MTVVVSDASPIHYLVLVGHEQVLHDLFMRVIIPNVVLAELCHQRSPDVVRTWALSLPGWVEMKQPIGGVRVAGLDPGEADAIALAKELRADALLIDERQGRLIAKREGLTVYGTIGVLEAAAAQGLLDLAKAFERLGLTNFRGERQLFEEALGRDQQRQRGRARKPHRQADPPEPER